MSKSRSKQMAPLSSEQAAYIAGILDGEGAVTISKKKDQTGMRRGCAYRPVVSVANTKYELLLWLHATTGLGSITKGSRPNAGHRSAWRWTVWSNQAGAVLRAVLPYLVLKRLQADLVLDFISRKRYGVGRKGLSDEEWSRQENAHAQLLQLNKRGA